MQWHDDSHRIKILSWAECVDGKTYKQAVNLSNHPACIFHVGLMPDTHMGYGMPIGGVIACDNAVIPYGVGSDIGCGMSAVKTNLRVKEWEKFSFEVRMEIEDTIPLGFEKWNKKNPYYRKMFMSKDVRSLFENYPEIQIIKEELSNARKQMGTLGGGNHFIEIQVDEKGFIWIMLHSGSRHMGKTVADYYHDKAISYCSKYGLRIPTTELAYFHADSEEGQEYIRAMNYCLEFAYLNRFCMMNVIKSIFEGWFENIQFEREINIHHNYASQEIHFGKKVWIHRKGATSAKQSEWGIIPGSMGTASYIVQGLGNELSFKSCSHGSGRRKGRNEATRTLDVKKQNEIMQGVIFSGWKEVQKGNLKGMFRLDEAPEAYKDIETVIDQQKDLVVIRERLVPLAAVKG